MTDDLVQLETWAGPLLAKLEPAQRRRLARTIALELRRSTQKRIAAQRQPDSSAYPPRKPKKNGMRAKRGAIRRRQEAMFVKLRTARWLRVAVTADAAEVGFQGRVARLARVHQDGLTEPSERGKAIRYPRRQLLGFTPADRDMVRNRLVDYLGDGTKF